MSAESYALAIGGRANIAESFQWFDGDIDEVRVWNRARSEEELRTTRSDTLGPAYYSTIDSGLVLYFRFDKMEDLGIGKEGRDIRDLSAMALHGVMRGNASIVTEIRAAASPDIPQAYALQQNYPNPFNSRTTIRYQLPEACDVKLDVHDMLGQLVAHLVHGHQRPGNYEVRFDASGLASGVYFYRMQAGDFVQTRRLCLIR